MHCNVAIRQVAGGKVLVADVLSVYAFDLAVQQCWSGRCAAPLPDTRFEPGFSQTLTIPFTFAAP